MPLIRVLIGQFIHSMIRQPLVSGHIYREWITTQENKLSHYLPILLNCIPCFQEEFINYLAASGCHFSVYLVSLQFLNSINTPFDIYFCNTLVPKMSFLSVKKMAFEQSLRRQPVNSRLARARSSALSGKSHKLLAPWILVERHLLVKTFLEIDQDESHITIFVCCFYC